MKILKKPIDNPASLCYNKVTKVKDRPKHQKGTKMENMTAAEINYMILMEEIFDDYVAWEQGLLEEDHDNEEE